MIATLKASIWSAALVRRAETQGAYATVMKKGDPDAGAALVVVNTLDGRAVLYRPVRNFEGERIWWPKGPESEVDIGHYITQRLDDDPDLWVVEIEDRAGRHFLTEPIEEK